MKGHKANVQWINQTGQPMPRAASLSFLQSAFNELVRRGVKPVWQDRELNIIFLDTPAARKLNFAYRHKNKATDILSFSGEREVFGELLLCAPLVRRQAKEHGLLLKEEVAYLLLHGVLHLLGFDHESKAEARKMFALQDSIFAKLCPNPPLAK